MKRLFPLPSAGILKEIQARASGQTQRDMHGSKGLDLLQVPAHFQQRGFVYPQDDLRAQHANIKRFRDSQIIARKCDVIDVDEPRSAETSNAIEDLHCVEKEKPT
jgi:hypothetical protein